MAHCWCESIRRRARSKQILNEELDLEDGGELRISPGRLSIMNRTGVSAWVGLTDDEMIELRDALIEHYGDGGEYDAI